MNHASASVGVAGPAGGLTVDARAMLVSLGVVRAVTGWHATQVFAAVDGTGPNRRSLIWVFNFASHPTAPRKLRFWTRELESPEETRMLGVEEVIGRILPERRLQFSSGEVLRMFELDRPTLLRLRRPMGGRLDGARNCHFPRAAVAAFLRARWLAMEEKAE